MHCPDYKVSSTLYMYKVLFDPVARLFSAHRTQSAAEMLIASFIAVHGVKFNHSNSLLAMAMHHMVQTYYSTMIGRVLWFSI